MVQEMKYVHTELVEAVERVENLGDFDQQVNASKRAGEILNSALDAMEDELMRGVVETLEDEPQAAESQFDNSGFRL